MGWVAGCKIRGSRSTRFDPSPHQGFITPLMNETNRVRRTWHTRKKRPSWDREGRGEGGAPAGILPAKAFSLSKSGPSPAWRRVGQISQQIIQEVDQPKSGGPVTSL